LLLTSLAVLGLMTGSGGFSPVAAAATFGDPVNWLNLATDLIGPITPNTVNKGSDNRLVVLVVGSDYRASTAGTGERTDMMMLLTINNSKQISAASLPRDVGNVPICNGQIYKPKINGLFKYYKQTYGTRDSALEHMRQAFQCTFKIQIDYIVYLRFTAVDRLTDEVDGVYTSVPRDYLDKSINDERTTQHIGAKFLQDTSVLMKGTSAPYCYTVLNGDGTVNWGASPNCTRLLLYGRTRHGPGNNDWVRAKRQQNIFFDALKRVTGRSTSDLESLRQSALSNSLDFYTTMPTSATDAVTLYNMFKYSTMPNQVVFKPSKWASTVPGTSKQQLKIDVVRQWMHDHFGPL
jgi:anionic cell wall polymer biosynthesis LytR-Cps2A-Psr (LCP) family protein